MNNNSIFFENLSEKQIQKEIQKHQKHEITEHFIYLILSKNTNDKNNKKILNQIANDELRHYLIWKNITNKEIKPSKFKIFLYTKIISMLGLTFTLRLMEQGEIQSQEFYRQASKKFPDIKRVSYNEEKHEQMLITILNDEKLSYAGSIVLGLNDALVELTGTLAGLSLAFTNTTIVGITGIIMGVAASLSMAASEFLSSEEDQIENDFEKSSIKSAMYTGFAYIITVILLVIPYFIFSNIVYSLTAMLSMTLIIILCYTSYMSIAKNLNFKKKFLTMAIISLSVAAISFGVGYLVKIFFGIDI